MRFVTWSGVVLGVAALGFLGAGCEDDNPGTVASSSATGPSTSATNSGGSGGSGGTGGAQGGGGAGVGGGGAPAENVYAFESKFNPGESAVAYDGQTFRHTLIEAMKGYLGGLTAQIDGANPPADGNEVVAALQYYYAFDSATSLDDNHGVSTDPEALQATWADISGGTSLMAKIAGSSSRASTGYKDWTVDFSGWSDNSINGDQPITAPETLVLAFFDRVGALADDRINGIIPLEPGTSNEITAVFVDGQGRDYQQLLQKFLLGAVAYSQGTDDYLHDDVADKGLLSVNTQDGDAPYTVLGHHWDEGFGYFGAARDYLLYTDEELASAGGQPDWQGMHDSNGDAFIDLKSEINWGASVNCAKRDLGAQPGFETDLTADAMNAFLAGRRLIHEAGDELTSSEQADLLSHAEQATLAWEHAIAATVIHYINDTIADTQAIDAGGYDFYDHAKHWSEMKGFALSLQFNPKKKVTDEDLGLLHGFIGDAPVTMADSMGERQQYIADLRSARDLLETAYGFANENVEGW